MATSEKEIAKLTFQRTVHFNRLKEIYEYGTNSTTDSFYKENLLSRAEFLQEIYADFQSIHNDIISLIASDTDFAAQDKIRKLADKYLYDVKSKVRSIQSPAQAPAASDFNTSQNTSPLSAARLPKINIPIFEGNIKMWPSFFDLFKSIIHTNVHLSNVEKFHYLITSLKQEPLNLIKGLPLTEDNYETAYNSLVTRYENKRFLATAYLNEIFDAPCLQKQSPKDIRHLLNTFTENIDALKAQNMDTDGWDFVLFNILARKLDTKSRTEFELQHNQETIPTYKMLTTFLSATAMALETVQHASISTNFKHVSSGNGNRKPSSVFLNSDAVSGRSSNQASNFKCALCSQSHALYRCYIFTSKSPNDRFNFAKSNSLCLNCLHPRHSARNCKSSTRCRVCNQLHHTLLHLNQNPAVSYPSNDITGPQHSASTSAVSSENSGSLQALQCSSSSVPHSFTQSTVLLSTAVIQIKDNQGNFHKIRALLDTGGMANFISERFVNRLGLRRQHSSISLEGINDQRSISNKGVTQCLIKPCSNQEPTFNFHAVILPKVCSNQPKVQVMKTDWNHIANLQLADPAFDTPGSVDMLIGAELMPYILGPGRIFGKPGQPVALETVFGWVLQGKADMPSAQHTSLLISHVSCEPQVDQLMQKFWEIENPSCPSDIMSADEIKCENIYKSSVYRDSSGRFVVSLPFRHSKPNLGDSYTQALRRFNFLESRLSKNPDLYKAYSDFIRDYIEQGYISQISPRDYQCSTAFYLPHHCVIKPDSVSTKLRIVFDASAKTTSGYSLNDVLFPGPKLHQDLTDILFKFRTHPIAFISDIKQMYCQILVQPEHRNFQRFLWRFSRSEALSEYVLNRVTFGISSAPYLALRTLKELALIEQENYPLASKVIQSSVYIDDCVAGADDLKAALNLQNDLILLLKKGGFELRKWASNCPDILSNVPSENTQISFDTDGPTFLKVLGLQWDPKSDFFSYSFNPIDSLCTKRSILSQIARIFDPLGLLSPCVLSAKHIMQQLWLAKTDWDETPSKDIIQVWKRFKEQLPDISNIRIPRLIVSDSVLRVELHGFCDASSIGYGCVVYFRFITSCGTPKVVLISGKSKVAPLKVVSIPRLELCSAHLLTELIVYVTKSYSDKYVFDATYAWSDSQVALTWVKGSAHRWKTFVANRVSYIQENLKASTWHYVPTEINPADCVSRGLTPSELVNFDLWWHGPEFLESPPELWPEQPAFYTTQFPDVSQEQNVLTNHVAIENLDIIDLLLSKFSAIVTVQRIIAYILRFNPNHRLLHSRTSKNVSPDELQTSMHVLVKFVQQKCFSDLIRAVKHTLTIQKPFRKLSPFLDHQGILRVGGRLKNSLLAFETKHPILLPKNHRLTDLIIEHAHRENLHPGLKTLHNILLQNFWIISPRSAIYRCLSTCIKCFRTKPRSLQPHMANLPSYRVSQVKPFSRVCVDYAGPFAVTPTKRRGIKSLNKAYICVFVCCATKALHLELASDLTTDAFLACLRRFIARRGRVSDIYSDQGTNFKGASNELTSLAEAAASKLCIRWHFNPPGAPHFNGLSEAGVKSVKTHLFRVVGGQIMTYEEFYTLLTQIEALLNSRPLGPISEDPNDLLPLTPGHFLTSEPLSSFPEPDLTQIHTNHLSRWQLLSKMRFDFWKRWSNEYLHTLQQRTKWSSHSPNIQENTLVVIRNEQKSPLEWDLGRVLKLHPGNDGVVRVVTLKTAKGILQRPVVKVCPLPIN